MKTGPAACWPFWVKDSFEPCLTYPLKRTPCEFVYQGEITAFARDIGNIFPTDREWFAQLGVNSYLGIPIKGETGALWLDILFSASGIRRRLSPSSNVLQDIKP